MKTFVLVLTVLVSGLANAADLGSDQFSGSLKEIILVQPCGEDGECNTVGKTLSEVKISEDESLNSDRSLVMKFQATSPTKWQQGATILDVAAVVLTVNLPKNIPSFGASTTGSISLLLRDGEGRGLNIRDYSASCSISGTQKQVSCTSEGFGSPSHFLTISLSR